MADDYVAHHYYVRFHLQSQTQFKDLCPISMAGCLYKVIAKILANGLKIVMPTLERETPSTFVSGKQILDGVLIANEVVRWLKKANVSVVLLKLDFHKAYNMTRYDGASWIMYWNL